VVMMLFTLTMEATSAMNPAREDYRTVAEYLQTQALPTDVVYVTAPFTIYPIEYYHQSPAPLETIPNWERAESGPIPPFSEDAMREQVASDEQDHGRAWVITSYNQGYEDDVVGFFDANYRRLYENEFSPGLVLRLYQFGSFKQHQTEP
jgi:mannosyltransferase